MYHSHLDDAKHVSQNFSMRRETTGVWSIRDDLEDVLKNNKEVFLVEILGCQVVLLAHVVQ